jgi:hypothetical protein
MGRNVETEGIRKLLEATLHHVSVRLRGFLKMKVRLRLSPSVQRQFARNRDLASVGAALLTPASAMALVLGAWRLGSDLSWTGEFAISQGLFSHWQVWIAMAGLLQTCASLLGRHGRGGGHEAMP